jgi:hypothetical protein
MKRPISRIDKLRAMADPARNSNAHERAVAAAKLAAALKAEQATAWKPTPGTPITAAAYARAHGLDPKKFRKRLRSAGLAAPYTLDDFEKVT